MLSVYTETTLNRDFNPKSAIVSINTNTKKKNCLDSYHYIIRDGLSQKTISRYCPFKKQSELICRKTCFALSMYLKR